MKIFTLFLFLLFTIVFTTNSYSQVATWRQMSDFPGGPRAGAFSFSIGTKVYVGGGSSNGVTMSDFWEYDVNEGSWTRKANFGGGKRAFAVAFAIGNKGYAGTGAADEAGNTIMKDFWQYNPATNKWVRKADFGGGIRYQAFGAATTDRGYVGTGLTSKDITSLKRDLWEYNPATNQWRKRDNLGFIGRFGATAFALNGKLYAGTGLNNFAQTVKDFYEYNPARNRWRRKASYPGTGVFNAVSFAIGGVGYLGTGLDENGTFHNEFFKYDFVTDKWTKAPALPGAARSAATAVSNNNSGFVITGFNGSGLPDVWNLEQLAAPAAGVVARMPVAAPSLGFGAHIGIAPNPANTHFTLRMQAGTTNAKTVVYVYTLQGRLVQTHDLGIIPGTFTKNIAVANLPAGMYKVAIAQGTLRESLSLLIAR